MSRAEILLVRGHTDAKGSDVYNQQLSEWRAVAVKRFIVETFGIPPENLIAVGLGKRELKNTADPFAAENRRVQVLR
jgi:outer membrane protein OmpA-like peptidoglycan-associated protein